MNDTPWWALNSRHQIDRFDARDLREAVLHMLLCVLSKPAFKMMMLMSCSHALSALFGVVLLRAGVSAPPLV